MGIDGFLTLHVRIEFLTAGRYRATTEGERRGPQAVEFALPFSQEEGAAWLERFQRPFDIGQPDRWRTLEAFGSALFNAVFQGESLATWRLLYREAHERGQVLRVVLHLLDDTLQPLPWEALYDENERFFLARDPLVCLLRFPRDPAQLVTPPPRRPLRLLALISQPDSVTPLDVAEEKRLLEAALHELIERREVELSWIDGRQQPATLARLSHELQRAAEAGRPYDIFHYIGHAEWSDALNEGVLLLETADRSADPTTALQLGELLRGGTLRLAVLNACEGGRAEQALPFRSVAAALTTGADLPAVIANQIKISDEAAKAFAQQFYGTLAKRRTVEEGVIAGRAAVALSFTHTPEWIATVFFSRYLNDPIRLLPDLPMRGGYPLLTAFGLFLLSTLLGITVISLVRTLGLAVGASFQLGVWALALWFAHDRWEQIVRFRHYVVGAVGLATLAVLLWFAWQPVLRASPPPPTFGLSLEEPSPFAFYPGQIVEIELSVDVTGHVVEVPSNHHLWMLIQAENSATFAAGAEARLGETGTFIAPEVIVGPPAARLLGGRRYMIQPILVDEEGHRFLEQHRSAFWRFFHPDFRVTPPPRLQNALVIRR